MDTSSIENVIDLPAAPLRNSMDEGSLLDADIEIHRVGDRAVTGKLCRLSKAEMIAVVSMDAPAKKIRIPFSKILFIRFTKKHLIGNSIATEQQQVPIIEPLIPVQDFDVHSAGENYLSGKTYGSFVDLSGIHVFQLVDPAYVQRLFFPFATVNRYQIGKLLGEELLDMEDVHINPQDIQHALQKQRLELERVDCSPDTKRETGLLESKSKNPDERQGLGSEKKLGHFLQELGSVTETEVQRALAKKTGIPFLELDQLESSPAAILLVSKHLAQKYCLLPLRLVGQSLVVAMEDPYDKDVIDIVQFVTNYHLDLVIATRDDIEAAIDKYYRNDTLESDLTEAENILPLDLSTEEDVSEGRPGENLADRPMVRLVSNFLLDAVHRKASDIHIRPLEKSVDLIYRIDGTLYKIRNFSKQLLPSIVSRIKVLGKMDVAERRMPQDGQARVIDGKNTIDLRISVLPTTNGESAVIRLLNKNVGIKSIAQLGFNFRDAEVFTNLLHMNNGLILVTGPTGSGKSTTLYAALQTVIERNLNIITVENPVEYHIDGIEQVQVNTAPGYTFARTLRQILRHDPDVIMIGEIRDDETAKIAIESALTGHLVLSTLHTNDSASSVTRLLEMGVDPFLIDATVLGIFAQRLVRKNCQKCIQQQQVDPLIAKALRVGPEDIFYKGIGCNECNETGYAGRLAVYELLQITPALRKLIKPGVLAQDIHDQAVKDGMVPLTENALQQAKNKITSLEEVYRVRLAQ